MAHPSRDAFAAVDLGSSSGRIILGVREEVGLGLREVHRFVNVPIRRRGRLLWDVARLFEQTLTGLAEVVGLVRDEGLMLRSIGVDSWGVDYGLVTAAGQLRPEVGHHRDGRIDPTVQRSRGLTEAAMYARTGIPDLPINTAFQLTADVAAGRAQPGDTILLIPDLWVWLLTGVVGVDPTIASTTQLFDPRTRSWATDVIGRHGLDELVFPDPVPTGTLAGRTTAAVTQRIGSESPVPVVRVAGHDTACAFAFATPPGPDGRATGLISSGSWSLAGLVLDDPILDPAALAAGFSNELGVGGHPTFIRNLSGMWILQECMRAWGRQDGGTVDLDALLAATSRVPSDDRVFDTADERLLNPPDMAALVADLCAEVDRPRPRNRPEVVRAVLDSLAESYASSVGHAVRLAGVTLDHIRIVGGGSRNELLSELTAERTGLDVLAGPAEASALGNIAIQMAAVGTSPSAAAVYDHLLHDTTTRHVAKRPPPPASHAAPRSTR